ncbi:MAG: hypothetical protein WA821_13820 [Anaerolineales bacterium]
MLDTNLIFLIITIILFIAVLIFDFAFFRFRERKFDDDEPLSFLTQNTLRSLRAWINTLGQPKLDEPSSLESTDQSEADFVIPATTQVGTVSQSATLASAAPTVERPTVHVKITADVPEGTVVHITMQVTDAEGKILIPNSDLTSKTSAPTRTTAFTRRPSWIAKQINKFKNKPGILNPSLFWGSIVSYALIISFAISKWPIYFFTDEAVHMNMIADFLRNGFQNYDGEFLPTFFIKEGWVNGTSVYLQLLPYLMFGKSVVVTRLVSAIVTLLGAIAVGLLLKKVLKVKYYWVGIFLLLTTPAWFLHARTAFEYAEVASFYCIFIYFYGRYRKGDMRALYFAIFGAALCFYTHGLGQILTGVTGVALFVVDFRYHIHPKRRKTVLLGLGLVIILLLPFARYYHDYPTEIAEQVKRRDSYWSNTGLLLSAKILEFLNQYFYGLNPMYWYFPNDIDIDRHRMVGAGIADGLLITLPFMLVGFFQIFKTIRNLAHRIGIIALVTVFPILTSTIIHTMLVDGAWKTAGVSFTNPLSASGDVVFTIDPAMFASIPPEVVTNTLWIALAFMRVGLILAFIKIRKPSHKLVLIAWLACPIPASVVAIGMPRTLWVSVPLAILTAIGISAVMQWLENHWKLKPVWGAWMRFVAYILLFTYWFSLAIEAGMNLAGTPVNNAPDAPNIFLISILLGILVASGLAYTLYLADKRYQITLNWGALGLFAALVSLSLFLLRTALVDGPLWFQDYGLYGMQYGAQQVFGDTIRPALDNDPNISFVVSPSWANGTEQFTDFFIPQELQSRLHMGQPIDFLNNLNTYTTTEFIATADEFSAILRDPKFIDVNVIKTIPCPNGAPCFYVITLKPASNIADILVQQHAQNRNPVEDTMVLNGQTIRVRHSPLGSGAMADIFDNDPDTLSRVLEANPFYIDLYPIPPIDTHSVFIKTGSLHNYTITIRLYAPGSGQPVEYTQTYQDQPDHDLPPDPQVTIVFDKGPAQSDRIEIEIKDNTSGDTSAIHIRTILFCKTEVCAPATP